MTNDCCNRVAVGNTMVASLDTRNFHQQHPVTCRVLTTVLPHLKSYGPAQLGTNCPARQAATALSKLLVMAAGMQAERLPEHQESNISMQ